MKVSRSAPWWCTRATKPFSACCCSWVEANELVKRNGTQPWTLACGSPFGRNFRRALGMRRDAHEERKLYGRSARQCFTCTGNSSGRAARSRLWPNRGDIGSGQRLRRRAEHRRPEAEPRRTGGGNREYAGSCQRGSAWSKRPAGNTGRIIPLHNRIGIWPIAND
jgi:hypothetical protein